MQVLNTEDKKSWIDWGVKKESDFLRVCQKYDILSGIEKSSGPVYFPEFVYQDRYLDLKTVHTPFFLAQRKYNIDPNFAVTLNKQDVTDCNIKYPKCQIVFWVNWKATTNFGVSVEKKQGIWFLSYEQMIDLVEDAPLHAYQNRIDDTKGNAKDSYVLDLRKMDKKI
jgi:hypothetical protein